MKFQLLIVLLLCLSCRENNKGGNEQIKTSSHKLPIIPLPKVFTIEEKSSSIKQIVLFIDQRLRSPFTDVLIEKMKGTFTNDRGKANTSIQLDTALTDEAYSIQVRYNKINIIASSKVGVQHALVSLHQYIQFNGYPLPIMEINDEPNFSYRGMHLDVARHFFSVNDIKKYIDYLAEYKYNKFHWHLTEDQGWRIEIKKYPKLQEIAAWRKETLIGHYNDTPHLYDGKKYGGYYTQDEIKGIVKYALDRNIEIIPEIEMPGHSQAALAAYPELACSSGPFEVATKWGVFEDVFCPTEKTFEFLEGVIDEVVTLFPSKYIHIGGDECPKTAWKNSAFCQRFIKEKKLKDEHGLQSYFIERMEKYINSKGKKIIGWDEILEGGLAPNATVMSWRGIEGGLVAARQNHDVIMTPGTHCYFDHYQSDSPEEPIAIGGLTTLSKVFGWNPVPKELEQDKHKFILGGQANVWTEYIDNFNKVEYMAFSRGMAMSEALWTGGNDYNDFLGRYEIHNDAMRKKGINVANHLYDVKVKVAQGKNKTINITFDHVHGMAIDIFKGKEKLAQVFSKDTFVINESGDYRVIGSKNGKKGKISNFTINLHKGTKALIAMNPLPSEKYPGNGPSSIINGIYGENSRYGGSEWLGFEGDDVNIILDFEKSEKIVNVSMKFFKGEGQWIYLPKSFEILGSHDSKAFTSLCKGSNFSTDSKILTINQKLDNFDYRYMKILVKNHGVISAGAAGAGHRAWLFIDEIVCE